MTLADEIVRAVHDLRVELCAHHMCLAHYFPAGHFPW